MKKLAFVFHHFPHSTSSGREGLDALLAASAYTEDISVFFLGDGVTQLLKDQSPDKVLSRDYISAFKLMDLYDIENVYVCQSSLKKFGLSKDKLLIEVECLSGDDIINKLSLCDQLLTF
ncbi:MAG: sulfurtransferase complex subunit TusC [Vibrio gallaecicus]|uniref:sulfurtransferase complex subunit TusC n=1 Tax=Vibrio gallaecicus TaxID=552386 RepID=UPI0010C9E04F|nr:sulfurtransferase complex subunit TusC [Vibrio gallaecicus]MDN3615345.1 sulfurtransferase complex subunit TusC [Vibrio gallaecicus]